MNFNLSNINFNLSTFFDIGVLLIIVILGIVGYRQGFVITVFRWLRLLVTMVISLVLTPHIAKFLTERDRALDFMAFITTEVEGGIDSKLGDVSLVTLLPTSAKMALNKRIDWAVETISYIILSIAIFLILIILINIAKNIIINLFSSRKRGGFIGGTDRILGLLLGVAQGILIVSILALVLIPAMSLAKVETCQKVLDAIGNSTICYYFYYNNPLLLLI